METHGFQPYIVSSLSATSNQRNRGSTTPPTTADATISADVEEVPLHQPPTQPSPTPFTPRWKIVHQTLSGTPFLGHAKVDLDDICSTPVISVASKEGGDGGGVGSTMSYRPLSPMWLSIPDLIALKCGTAVQPRWAVINPTASNKSHIATSLNHSKAKLLSGAPPPPPLCR
jgi:hypothetical protein